MGPLQNLIIPPLWIVKVPQIEQVQVIRDMCIGSGSIRIITELGISHIYSES